MNINQRCIQIIKDIETLYNMPDAKPRQIKFCLHEIFLYAYHHLDMIKEDIKNNTQKAKP